MLKARNAITYYLFAAAILYATYLLLLLSVAYLNFNPTYDFLITKQFVYHIDLWRIGFYIHVFSSVFVLFFGLFQFSITLYKKWPKFHKFSGYTYSILLLLISGPGGLVMSFYANGGIYAQLSFVSLSSLWILTTLCAIFAVWKKQFSAHGNWMLRSYALTLSAVTLRFYVFLCAYFKVNLGPVETYVLVSYLSWIPNLLVAEWMIHRKFSERFLQ